MSLRGSRRRADAGGAPEERRGSGEATGEPITVMTVGTLGTAEGTTTSIEQTALAYEGWINATAVSGPMAGRST